MQAPVLRGSPPPAAAGPTGLPIGVELDGPLGSDRRLLAIGLAFDKVLDSERAPAV